MNLIQAILLKIKIKRAIKEANEISDLTGRRYLVFMHKGKVVIMRKQEVKKLIAMRKFKKGIKIEDIEKQCIHITN